MEYFKTVFKNRKLVYKLGMNNFKNKFAGTGLGAIWGFIQPFIFMITYVIVFQYILKVGNTGDLPYLVWFLPGMSMWMFINESILSASSSIRGFSYLVKKVVFPVDIIPNISLFSSSIVGLFLIVITTLICSALGYFPNPLQMIYILFAAYCFIIAIIRLTTAICTLVPDFVQLLSVVMQLFFWFTPIVWNMSILAASNSWLVTIMKCSPFAYLVSGFRSVFVNERIITANNGLYTIIFWVITIVIFCWGDKVFKKSKKDFADVL